MSSLLLAALISLPAGSARADTGDAPKQAQMHYLKGMLLEKRGALPEALVEYEQALQADPNSGYVNREAAELALELGNADKALEHAERLAVLEPKAAESYVLLGRVKWARGDMDGARDAFERALKLDPKSSDSIFSLSSLLAAHSPKKARELLERFLREQPSQASDAHFQLAKIDLQEGNGPKAIEHLKQSVALDPDGESLPARYALAQAYEIERSTPSALKEYIEIAKLEPDNVALLDHIGEIYVADEKWDEAIEWFEKAKRLQNGDPSANHWLSLYQEKQNDYNRAADILKASSALPDDAPLALRLSYYLSQAGRTAEAVSVLEDAHKRFPKNDQVAYFLALGYQDQKREKEAIKLLEQVVAVKPEYRDARYQLGVLLEKQGDLAGAESQFRALLAARPDDASALNYLGYTLAERGLKLDEAEKMIAKAVELEPGNAAYQDSLGWVHYKLGRTNEALAEMRGALKLLADDETVWDHYGDIAKAAGRDEEAWLAWKRSQALTSGKSEAARKAYKLQKKFSRERLGGLFQRHLSAVQGGLRKLTGLAELVAHVGPKTVKVKSMATYKAPDALSIEVLGPLFTPLARFSVQGSESEVQPLHLEGVPDGAAESAAEGAVSAMRDYFSAKGSTLEGARYRKRWWSRKRWIEAGPVKMFLDADENVVVSYRPGSGPVDKLDVEDLGRDKGRLVPRRLTARGRGFEIGLFFTDVKLDLAPLTGPGE